MSENDDTVASQTKALTFRLELDSGNPRHQRLRNFFQRALSGNAKYVALEMLLKALPENAEQEMQLIVDSVKNRPPKKKPTFVKRNKVARLPDIVEQQSTVSSKKNSMSPSPDTTVNVAAKTEVEHADVGIGMLGKSFKKY